MAVSSKDDVLERVKSFVFYLNEPMKLDDYQTAQNNLQQAWNTATGGKIIRNLPECYVMLWPALTWRGQEWAQHVQGQLLHTCIMKIAGSPHVMELLTVSI